MGIGSASLGTWISGLLRKRLKKSSSIFNRSPRKGLVTSMDGELELSGQIAETGIVPGKQHVDGVIPLGVGKTARSRQAGLVGSAIPSEASRTIRRLQAWHYLIIICAAFWLLFATILLLSGFYFLIVALAILALLSVLVVALAWAFQNNI